MENKPAQNLHLYCVLLGCTPTGRNIEQHDIMFGVAENIEDLYEEMKIFWHRPVVADVAGMLKQNIPGLDVAAFSTELLGTLAQRDKVHIDAWMKVQYVDGYKVTVQQQPAVANSDGKHLYFINLGGYMQDEFEEFHKKILVVANGVTDAVAQLKNHQFMKQYTPQALGGKAKAHFDDRHKIEWRLTIL